MSDYCSVSLRTEDRPPTDETPLEQYRPRGYAPGDKALDAAVALTASTWGPPLSTACDDVDDGDDGWWFEAYLSACRAVETAIVNALEADGRAGQ